jgi:aldehyde:ferredoxin oxidoreductase
MLLPAYRDLVDRPERCWHADEIASIHSWLPGFMLATRELEATVSCPSCLLGCMERMRSDMKLLGRCKWTLMMMSRI